MRIRRLDSDAPCGWAVQMMGTFRFGDVLYPAGRFVVQIGNLPREVLKPWDFNTRYRQVQTGHAQ